MVKRTKHGRQVDDLQNSIDLVGKYTAAMNTRESAIMDRLRSPDFELDFVYGDVFQTQPLSGEGTERFWPTWFNAFPDGEFEPTRTIAGEQVIVVQWTFSGTHKQTLGEPIMTPDLPATNRIVCFRGVSIYDINGGLITRETTYLDLATIMVEMGVTL